MQGATDTRKPENRKPENRKAENRKGEERGERTVRRHVCKGIDNDKAFRPGLVASRTASPHSHSFPARVGAWNRREDNGAALSPGRESVHQRVPRDTQ
jgi:hypothetical protein